MSRFMRGTNGTTFVVSIFLALEIFAINGLSDWSVQIPLNLTAKVPSLGPIIKKYRPDLSHYEDFYRKVHQDPEISGREEKTAALVTSHLRALDFNVTTGIGGYGLTGILENGPGKVVLIRAELDALPIEEQTDLPYKSTKRMADRYGNERPIMHACGHDMNMATLLGASELLKAARSQWSGTLIALLQPAEEDLSGAQAMIDDGLYDKIPVPDVMLGQHLTPLPAGHIAVQSGPVLVAADSINVRIIGGPCEGSPNPQWCVDPIPLATGIVTELQDYVRKHLDDKDDATVACWEFHAGIPGNDFVAYVDFLLDIKTFESHIRQEVLALVKEKIRSDCAAARTPKEPVLKHSVRAPLTVNNNKTTAQVQATFDTYFGSTLVPMELTRSCEDFSILGAPHNVPYTYWNFGGSKESKAEEIPENHSPYYAPEIQPTLEAGTDAMALAVLSFLVKEVQT